MSIEKLKEFKRIDDMYTYVRDGIISGKFTLDEVAKFARVMARQGIEGEEIITVMADGLEETRNVVKVDENGNPGWVLTNPDGEQYIVPDATFNKKYEIDPENPDVYKPKGGPVISCKTNENIEFTAPWGEPMKIEAGGSLIINNPNDIYGIQKTEFENTYATTGKEEKEILQEIIEKFDITKEEIEQKEKERAKKSAKRLEFLGTTLDEFIELLTIYNKTGESVVINFNGRDFYSCESDENFKYYGKTVAERKKALIEERGEEKAEKWIKMMQKEALKLYSFYSKNPGISELLKGVDSGEVQFEEAIKTINNNDNDEQERD